MKKNFFTKQLFLVLFAWLPLLTFHFIGETFATETDYDFYKKYGHKNKEWNEDVQKGFEAYDQQNCDLTLTYLKRAVAAQCQDPLVYYKLAVCSELMDSPYTGIQYYQLAQEKLDKLRVTHRYKNDIYESYGRVLFKVNRHDQAFPLLSKAVALGSPSFGLYYMVGYLYMKKGDVNAAVDMFNRALAQDISGISPEVLGGVYREVAKARLQQKDYSGAMALLQKATQLNPQDQEAVKLKNEASTGLQQNMMIQMIQTLTGPPPPAASQLPPLETRPMRDPTPPLETLPSTLETMPSPKVPTSPTKLEPLSPIKP